MANSPQLDKSGVCFYLVGFLKKKVGKKSGTYVKNYRNGPELLFEAISVSCHISPVKHKENLGTFPEKNLQKFINKRKGTLDATSETEMQLKDSEFVELNSCFLQKSSEKIS